MEWCTVDGCSEFLAGMLEIFSSWWNIVFKSSSKAILDQSAAPGADAWGWDWWITEVFFNSNRE
jgi:hypothetical protein